MKFERLFTILSYLAVMCGFFSLWISGNIGVGESLFFIGVIAAGYFLENTRFQLSERVGTTLIVLSLPLFYLGWRLRLFGVGSTGIMLAGVLARLILCLTAIKIFQRKADRDWILIYTMSFFQIMLAAGLSISPLYMLALVSYVFIMVCVIMLFEIRKTGRTVTEKLKIEDDLPERRSLPFRTLPPTAVLLIVVIISLAIPIFFMLPRVGGAGLGGASDGVSTQSGFSESVRLGGIGRLQQNEETVMRIKLDGDDLAESDLRWRGVALDRFDNTAWSRSGRESRETRVKDERGLIQLDYASGQDRLLQQTIYLEPLDTPVLFGVPRVVALQGGFNVAFKDDQSSVSIQQVRERISYKVFSDLTTSPPNLLRQDETSYTVEYAKFLQLPSELDPRIETLAKNVIGDADNRYDAAKNVERHLQTSYAYSLDMLAGGDQPLADFLFNVKAGHCEYFATAMAIMLRTQGIATRIVNGFSRGEYNETADMWVVRQRNAHSWVEVYFPETKEWVTFDPTPAAGFEMMNSGGGLTASFKRYADALEAMWIQYFVAFDDQEQRSLFTSARRNFSEIQSQSSGLLKKTIDNLHEWWSKVRGDAGTAESALALLKGVGYVVGGLILLFAVVWLVRKIVKLKVWRLLAERFRRKGVAKTVEFYETMIKLLAERGMKREAHQTPLEFAQSVNMPEAVLITEKYNAVRFGEIDMSAAERTEIESWLKRLKLEAAR